MMAIDGIDEVVNPSVFDTRGSSVFASTYLHGVRNVYERLTLTFGAAMIVGAATAALPPPHQGDASFTEPPSSVSDTRWDSSVAALKGLIGRMRSGARSDFVALTPLATETAASATARLNESVPAWAKKLAGDVDSDD